MPAPSDYAESASSYQRPWIYAFIRVALLEQLGEVLELATRPRNRSAGGTSRFLWIAVARPRMVAIR
jgi:hypothetical protein